MRTIKTNIHQRYKSYCKKELFERKSQEKEKTSDEKRYPLAGLIQPFQTLLLLFSATVRSNLGPLKLENT